MRARIGLALLALVVAPATASGQGLAQRVSAVDDGIVRLTYPTKPGVEICDCLLYTSPSPRDED